MKRLALLCLIIPLLCTFPEEGVSAGAGNLAGEPLQLAEAAPGQPRQITLVQDGHSSATVLIGSNPDRDAWEAARELVHYVEKATGATIPIVRSNSSRRTGVRILVGTAVAPPEVKTRLRRLRGEAFTIRISPGGTVVLAGNQLSGTSFAVYKFLERFLGIRWLWPGELGEVVPKASSLHFEPTTIEQEPSFVLRGLSIQDYELSSHPANEWLKRELSLGIVPDRAALMESQLWAKRNGFGGLVFHGVHAFASAVPPSKYGPTHPEYFALVKGKRLWQDYDGKHGAQLCTTNPEVIRLVTEYCNKTFAEHPEYEAISISPNDSGHFCECDRCRRLDTGAAERRSLGVVEPRSLGVEEGGEGVPVVTDRLMTFANQVAEGVARQHPTKKLVILAYAAYRQPPSRVKLHPNVIVQYELHANLHWDRNVELKENDELQAWSHAATGLAVYEYFVQGSLADMPRLFPELIQRSVRRIHELGYRYYWTQSGEGFATNGIDYYVLSKLLWDPTLDYKEIERDYIEKGFGIAAPAVARYYEVLAQRWQEMKSRGLTLNNGDLKTYESLVALYPPEFRAARRRDLEDALQLAKGQERRRVEFLNQGLRFVDLTLSAVERTIPLLQAGWKLSPQVVPPEKADMRVFSTAMAAWEDRDRFIESQKKTLVLSCFWVRYNDHMRQFNPLWKMRTWVKSNGDK